MVNTKKQNLLKLKLSIIPLLILLLTGVIFLVPFFGPIKFKVLESFHKLVNGSNSKNFSDINDLSLPNTKNVAMSNICNLGVKFNISTFKDPVVTDRIEEGSNNTQITLYSKDQKEDSISIICLKYAQFSAQLKNLVETSWVDNPESEKRYGMTLNQIKDLDSLEFYKKYTLISNSNCKEKDGFGKLPFVSASQTRNYQDKYIECDLSNTELKTTDYFFLPINKEKTLLLVRFIPKSQLSDKILVY